MQGNQVVRGGNIDIYGVDVTIQGLANGGTVNNYGGAAAAPLNQNLSGQELTSDGTVNFFNRGAILIKGGYADAGTASNSGARVRAKSVHIGADPAVPGSSAPKSLWIEGGTNNDRGARTSDPLDLARDNNQPNALLRADDDMVIVLGNNPALGAPTDALGNAIGSAYSLVIKGGTANLSSSGADPNVHYVTALGGLQASTLDVRTDGSILIEGGHATMTNATSRALVASSALILVEKSKNIDVRNGGSVVIRGGRTDFPLNDSIAARNTQALARMDPSKLTLSIAGSLVLEGGSSSQPSLAPLNSARIDAGDEIKISFTGAPISYTYNNLQRGQPQTLIGNFFMVGGSSSGFFDANGAPVTGAAFPITVSGGTIAKGADPFRGDSVVQTGLSAFNDSLLSYIIFAANVETRTKIKSGVILDDPCN
jgi:hypothetical protein